MSITVVIGAQFGGEGKGKMTAHLCRNHDFDIAVRCGGPNSGHTVTIDDKQVVLRQVPAGVTNDRTRLLLAGGCLIDLEVLFKEIDLFNLTPARLGIARNAMIIDQEYAGEELAQGLGERIGSTCTGTGVAVAKRVLRARDVRLARDVPELLPFLADVSDEVVHSSRRGERVVIEGTQGFGLSLYHSPYYPNCTSRDTTASAFLSEVGVSPLAVSEIVMVIRTFPIRVGGNSGPLPNEIDWVTLQRDSGYPHKIQEHTTVTKKLRRVARFDLDLVRRATAANMPTHLALMGTDYLDFRNAKATLYEELTSETKRFIAYLEENLGVRTDFVGTGPTDPDLMDLVAWHSQRESEHLREREVQNV